MLKALSCHRGPRPPRASLAAPSRPAFPATHQRPKISRPSTEVFREGAENNARGGRAPQASAAGAGRRPMVGKISLILLALLFPVPFSFSQNHDPGQAHGSWSGGHAGRGGTNYFNVTVPAHAMDVILCRPEATAMSLSLLAYQDLTARVIFGPKVAGLTQTTDLRHFAARVPVTIPLTGLTPNTLYAYEVQVEDGQNTGSGTFQTARPAGADFTFTLTADVHLDEHTSPAVYEQTLADIRSEAPDFHLDLGNLFMTDKHATRAEAARQYVAQRYYLGRIGAQVPVLLAQGTHDGEAARYEDGTANGLAAWSNDLRTRYFPDPVPDDFYTGNPRLNLAGQPLQDYFAWTWGDALFVVLDAFRYSSPRRSDDGWGWSLGKAQYVWLARTLAESHATFKFVFIHNLLSGDQASRGGVEIANRNEWGGQNPDGTPGFAVHRPGWDCPVRELLHRHQVAVVFRAHDNFYARQELDGMEYIMVPQPSFAGDDRIRDLQNYGYQHGVFRGNPGHVRVRVTPRKVTVDYVKTGGVEVADHVVVTGK